MPRLRAAGRSCWPPSSFSGAGPGGRWGCWFWPASSPGGSAWPASEALAAGLLYRFRQHDADTHITRWLQREPDSPLALLARGKLQEQREQTSEALLTYRRLLELDPEHDEARLRMTRSLLL